MKYLVMLTLLTLVSCAKRASMTTNPPICHVTSNGDQSVTITCSDGTVVVIDEPQDGTDGEDGTDGSSCSVVTENNTIIIGCTDGSSAIVPLPAEDNGDEQDDAGDDESEEDRPMECHKEHNKHDRLFKCKKLK